MKTWQLMRTQVRGELNRFLVTSALLGILNAIVIITLGVAVTGGPRDVVIGSLASAGWAGCCFAATAGLVAYTWLGRRVSAWFSASSAEMRGQLLSSFLRVEPVILARVPLAELREALVALPARLNNMVRSASFVVFMLSWAVPLICALFWMNGSAGLCLICAYAACLLYIFPSIAAMRQQEAVARAFDAEVGKGMADLLAGFKELALNRRKSDALFEQAIAGGMARRAAARVTYRRQLSAAASFNRTVESLIYLPCVAVIAILTPDDPNDAFVMFMIFGVPLMWMLRLPQLISMEASAGQILQLRDTIRAAASSSVPPEPVELVSRPESLEFRDVVYQYPNRRGFKLGPTSCRFDRGTITFVAGGNGSGKSTFIRVVAGLYPITSGRIALDGEQVDLRAYRDLFSVVLAEHMVFDRLYGVDNVDAAPVNAMLESLGVGHVTRFQNGRFTRLKLSTGQRKRVALVAALMERKPFLVLDEWAADQDPETRRHFYRVILPMLRADGYTVIAITHDDQYFDACDQLLFMEDGRLTPRP